MKFISLTLKCIFLSLLLSVYTKLVFAESYQFTIDYNVSYIVSEDGVTNVDQKATITNLLNDVIPTTYTFTAKSMKIYDVSAVTNGKSSEVKLEEKNDDTLVSVNIKEYAIGQGRQNEIELKYKTQSIPSQSGKIWNIYIPKIQISETTSKYDIKLTIPASFGAKIYLSPTPTSEKSAGKTITYFFNKETFKSTGITAAFGEYQPVNFKLKYQLKNSFIIPLFKEIALPPDIKNVQGISYQSINPKPYKIKVDKDGNAIATYILSPLGKLEIEVIGTAKLFGKQIDSDYGRNFTEIPKDLIKKYTKAEKYWEVNSPYVQKLASQLKDEKLNVIKNAQKIYDFITNNLTYDYTASESGLIERKGAEVVLTQKGSWTCMEFTDLFIATARAMGIPAREMNGYAFVGNETNKPLSISFKGGDLLHSWAEFYDPYYGWIQIDPTWGTTSGIDYFTKLDTGHLTFVVKGINSSYPFSAGTYRFPDNKDGKLIDVAFSQSITEDNFKPKIEAKKVFNWNIIRAIVGQKKYKVTNIGNVFIYNLNGQTLAPGTSKNLYLDRNSKAITYENLGGATVVYPL
ncbi:transglutaminase family protein [Patescibacteria group bacterium]|nr:transglutaminase family protein [Patescibacteria group bacterium]MBU1952982.1 transglutaminase family protein [Patescibacteria group bacterium]